MRFEFVKRYHRTGANIDDFTLDAEILQNAFQKARALLKRIRLQRLGLLSIGLLQKRDRRELVILVARTHGAMIVKARKRDGRTR